MGLTGITIGGATLIVSVQQGDSQADPADHHNKLRPPDQDASTCRRRCSVSKHAHRCRSPRAPTMHGQRSAPRAAAERSQRPSWSAETRCAAPWPRPWLLTIRLYSLFAGLWVSRKLEGEFVKLLVRISCRLTLQMVLDLYLRTQQHDLLKRQTQSRLASQLFRPFFG